MATFYAADLAYVHAAGFSGYARRLAPAILRLLERRDRRDDARTRRARGGARKRRPPVVFEVGCGSGALAQRLVEAGYLVVGLDISPTMIRMARRRAPGATFRVGSWASARVPRCAAVIAIGEILSYAAHARIAGAARHERALRRFFERVFAALEPGGLIIFDFIESAEGRTFARRELAGRDWRIVMQARVDRSGTTLTRRLATTRRVGGRVRRTRETHRVQIYPRERMAALLAGAGFEVRLARQIDRTRVFRSNLAAIGVKRPAPR